MNRRGDVVIMAFPFTDQSAKKRRPAVIVKNNESVANRVLPGLPQRCHTLNETRIRVPAERNRFPGLARKRWVGQCFGLDHVWQKAFVQPQGGLWCRAERNGVALVSRLLSPHE